LLVPPTTEEDLPSLMVTDQ